MPTVFRHIRGYVVSVNGEIVGYKPVAAQEMGISANNFVCGS
jgi:hypothetical protein